MAALWVMAMPFGFMGFLGIASLVGVIVSRVIVLFDFIEEAHESDLKIVSWQMHGAAGSTPEPDGPR